MLDLASHPETKARQTYLLKLSDALRQKADPVDIQPVAAKMLGKYFQADRASRTRQ